MQQCAVELTATCVPSECEASSTQRETLLSRKLSVCVRQPDYVISQRTMRSRHPALCLCGCSLSSCPALNDHLYPQGPTCTLFSCVCGRFALGCACLCVHMHMWCVKLDPAAESRAGNPTPGLQQKAFVALPHPCSLTPTAIKELLNSQAALPAINAGSELGGREQTGFVKKGVWFSYWSCCLHWPSSVKSDVWSLWVRPWSLCWCDMTLHWLHC